MDLAHTHLVLGVDLGQLHLLPEDAIDLVQLDGLLPVVEGAGDKNFVGRVFPVAKISRRRSDGRRRDAPGEGVFAHVGGGRRDRVGRGGGVSFGDGSERRIDKGCGGYASVVEVIRVQAQNWRGWLESKLQFSGLGTTVAQVAAAGKSGGSTRSDDAGPIRRHIGRGDVLHVPALAN